MPYEPNPAGLHPAYYFPEWHSGPDCAVEVIQGPTTVWVCCMLCRVAAQLDAISRKVTIESSRVPA